MSPDLEEALNEAREAGAPFGSNMAGTLLERIGNFANARAIFADPIERDGVTVIPVGKVSWGGGAGGGRGTDSKEGKFEGGEGGGGGGGLRANPVGYIEIRNGQAQFVRIRDIGAYVPLIIVGAIGSWVFARAIRAIFR
jgi:uncharacterized spore protein YtfJ